MATDTQPGIHLPARFLPVPTTISAEAQAMLQQPNPYGGGGEDPDPADKAAWAEKLQAREAGFTAMLAQHTAAIAPQRQVEHRLSHATLYEIEPADVAHPGQVLFYVHGGGFTMGGGIAAAYAAYGVAKLSGLRTFSIDYRMPPAAPFPAGLDDAVEAWRWLAERHGAQNIVAYGPSAGAGLLASCILKTRDLGLGMPRACVLHSPEADLTESGDSFETNLGVDPVLQRLTRSIALYADGHDLTDPYLSPLYGDFTLGFPPSLLSAGTRDLFLSNTVLMHRALRRAGIAAELHIWEAMGHAGFFGAAPEDHEVQAEQVRFLLEMLG
jgi:acetyl esterase/lipase